MDDALIQRAEGRLRAGDLGGAYDDARRALSASRDNGPAHFILSRIALIKGAAADALALCARAIALDGESSEYLAQESACLLQLGRRAEAHGKAVQALSFAGAPGPALEQASLVFHAVADYPRALEAQKRLALLEPGNSTVLANIGATHFLCGHAEEARMAFSEAIRLDPNNGRAYAGLSGVRAARADDNHIRALLRLIAEEKSLLDRVRLHHALAREYDELGMTKESFDRLRSGKAELIAATGYDVKQDIDMFAAIARYTDAAPPAPLAAASAQPIFIVGMPRSGTTVAERILTNCAGVVSLGECIEFVDLVKRQCEAASLRFADAAMIERHWRALPLSDIGEAYARFARAMAPHAARTVDKLPLNLLFVPLIVRALPNARIICMQRNPLDTVLGNYRQHLEHRTGTFNYTTSLAATAAYVGESIKLARRLAQLHPEQLLLLHYEELVADPGAKGRDMVRFCGLEWRDDAVKIEDNASPVGSASAGQVSAPIHARYVGRWKQCRDQLREAIKVLDAYGAAWDA